MRRRPPHAPVAALAAALLLAGCARRQEVAAGPVVVGPAGVTLPAEIAVTGPQSALCMTLPPDAVQGTDLLVTRGPGGPPVRVEARLVPVRGDPVVLGSVSVSAGRDVALCYESAGQLSEDQRYHAVTLTAADTVTVGPITWESGTRYKLLP